MVAIALIVVGVNFLVMVLGSGHQDDEGALGLLIAGAVLIMGGVILGIIVRDSQSNKNVKVDKSLTYTFTMKTVNGEEEIKDFSQIEKALSELEKTKTGTVNVKIEPAMATIANVECMYKNKAFYTYYLQINGERKGYWFSIAPEGTFDAKGNLKLLFVKHKKIDFYGLNYQEIKGEN